MKKKQKNRWIFPAACLLAAYLIGKKKRRET